ncbi:MAG: hypothetical protein RMK52_04270 [Chitinophagales bacterium]|nr:hypothetical protein [Chitinophagales bacterium]MDW8393443.1 hypothetical protein [Chitinophagales bacterium]
MKAAKRKQEKKPLQQTPQHQALWSPARMQWILAALAVVLYLPSIKLGFTELDDSIFIKEISHYYQSWNNLITSFRRGVFHETQDIYYRPLLLNSFLINYKLSGEDIAGWRWVNIVLHALNVVLVYRLLLQVNAGAKGAAILAAVFAVHPVLVQAVVWIPGRNDSLLGVFVFSYLLLLTRFAQKPTVLNAAGQFLLLLGGFFTKESGVLTPLAGGVLWLLVLRRPIIHRTTWSVGAMGLVAALIWFGLRSQATLASQQMHWAEMMQSFQYRLPVLFHYLGKVFFPVQLNVFPVQEDTSWVPFWITLGLITVLMYLTLKYGQVLWHQLAGGLMIYVIFLIPALLVPLSFNDQDLEHRLYVPLIGILMALAALQPRWVRHRLAAATVLVVLAVLITVNLSRHRYFNDPITFWEKAVADSPSEPYAKMMLASRLDKKDPHRADSLMRLAYRMDSSMKYINYYMGVLLQHRDSVLESEPYFLRELQKSDYSHCYFHLAHVAFEKQDRNQAMEWLQEYLRRNPADGQGNHNLLLLYYEAGDTVKLKQQVKRMRQLGLPVPDVIAKAADS